MDRSRQQVCAAGPVLRGGAAQSWDAPVLPRGRRAGCCCPRALSRSLLFSFPGTPAPGCGWARLHVPKIRFSQGAHKDSPAHTWLVNNSAQVQVSTGEGLPQFLEHAGGRAPGSSAVQEAQQRSYRAGQATAGSAGTQQPRRSCWPARWHAPNEHWGNGGQGHRFKRGHGRAEHEVSL